MKMKEFGLPGGVPGAPLDPQMVNLEKIEQCFNRKSRQIICLSLLKSFDLRTFQVKNWGRKMVKEKMFLRERV